MTVDDILDAKVGSSQVTAIYVGNTLIWPTVAYTYVITSATIHFSSGSKLDAGAVGSLYSGNYAWVTGTVRVMNGSTLVDTLTDVTLNVEVDNTTDFTVINNRIYGYNLGTTETSVDKETDVDATYRTSESYEAGTVAQVPNTVVSRVPSTVREYGTAQIAPAPVSGSYWATLVLMRYDTSQSPCPAYGDTAQLSSAGGHDEANFSKTPWWDVTTYHLTYASGSEADDGPYITAEGYTTPVQVGDSWGVDDDLSDNIGFIFSDGGFWAQYDYANDLLTIESAGKTTYNNPRSVTVTITNEDASASVTAYQQSNALDNSYYDSSNYAIVIVTANNLAGAGGVYDVLYDSTTTFVEEYTSGTYYTPENITSNLSTVPSGIATFFDEDDNEITQVEGSGTIKMHLNANPSTPRWVSVYMTKDGAVTPTAHDDRLQDENLAVLPAGLLYPVVNQNTGRISIKWEWDSDSPTPTYPLQIEFTNLAYHYILSGESTEHTSTKMGTTTVSFSANETSVALTNQFIDMSSGTSGRCWFTAVGVTAIAYDSTDPTATFPTNKTFNVREPSPFEPINP